MSRREGSQQPRRPRAHRGTWSARLARLLRQCLPPGARGLRRARSSAHRPGLPDQDVARRLPTVGPRRCRRAGLVVAGLDGELRSQRSRAWRPVRCRPVSHRSRPPGSGSAARRLQFAVATPPAPPAIPFRLARPIEVRPSSLRPDGFARRVRRLGPPRRDRRRRRRPSRAQPPRPVRAARHVAPRRRARTARQPSRGLLRPSPERCAGTAPGAARRSRQRRPDGDDQRSTTR